MVGKDLLIAVGGVIVAAQRSCTLNMDVDTIEVCSPVEGAWKKHIPTTIGWQVQCAGLIYNPEHADALIEAISKREMVRISFYDPELRMLRSGYAIMTTLEEGGSIGDMASQSMQFLGSGELEKVEASGTFGSNLTDSVTVPEAKLLNTENHPCVSSNDSVVVMEFDIERISRVSLQIGIGFNGVIVMYSSGCIDDITECIYDKNNIALYSYEVGHFARWKSNESVLLTPGKYFVACNGEEDRGKFILWVKSIPVN